jgi:hypothetical protein
LPVSILFCPTKAAGQLLKLRCFTGLLLTEAAHALGLSRTEGYRLWTFVRAWLRCELGRTVD